MPPRTSRPMSRTSLGAAILAGVIATLGLQSLAAHSPGGKFPASDAGRAAAAPSR